MSADRRQGGDWRLVAAVGLLGFGGAVQAEETDTAPDLDFLEYLGSWESSDEDWVLLADAEATEDTERKRDDEEVAQPDGEQLAELDDES